MKRANVLRLVAILAVVVLASMTTGCLKATITGKIETPPLALSKGEALPGTLTLTMTGYLAGGTFDKLDVEFFNENGDSLVEIVDQDINMALAPVLKKTDSVLLSSIQTLVAPDELWEGEVFVGYTAKFTVKPSALSYNLTPVIIDEVRIVEAE